MRLLVVAIAILFGVIMGARSPLMASIFYSWVTLFRPQDFVYSIGMLQYVVPLSFFLLFFTCFFFNKGGFKLNIGSYSLMCILFVCLMSAVFSVHGDIAFNKLLELLKIIAPAVLISFTIRSKRDFKLIMWTFLLSIGSWAIQGAIYGLASGRAQSTMSIGGQMSDRNDFAVGILMTLPISYYWGKYKKKSALRFVFYLTSLLISIAVIITNSRAAILGLIALILIALLVCSKHKLRNFFFILFFGFFLLNIIPNYTFERISTIRWGVEQSEGSASERIVLMQSGLRGALDNPFLGVGPGVWSVCAKDYIPVEYNHSRAYEPHSIWIKIPAELGFMGLAVYLSVVGVLFYNLIKIYRISAVSNDLFYYYSSVMLMMSLFAYCFSGTFFNQIYYEYFFLLIAVSGAYIDIFYNETAHETE